MTLQLIQLFPSNYTVEAFTLMIGQTLFDENAKIPHTRWADR